VSHESLGDKQFDAVRDILRDAGNRPALVHCQAANRVGALMLPYLTLDEHIPLDEARHMADLIGLRSPDYAALAIEYVRRHAALDD
jgi:protein tyrosine/serine phosphatase